MMDADVRDAELLEEGRLDELFAAYYPVLRQRALLRGLTPGEADDVVQEAVLRVYGEIQRGNRYRVPIRVVLHNVLEWKCAELFEQSRRRATVPLTDGDGPVPDSLGSVEDRDRLIRALRALPPREREVCFFHYLMGLEAGEIAQRLGMTRNAVYQAIHRAKGRLARDDHG
jgi:RNA polymerase sigma-70 factor (ECF subfamily)